MAATQLIVGAQRAADNQTIMARAGKDGEAMVSQMNGRYYEAAYRGRIYCATAFVAANVIYSTATSTGGPLIWNPPGSGVNVVLLKIGFGVSVASTATAAIGVTGAGGQLLIPASTTAADSVVTNTLIGNGPPSQVQAFRKGNPTNAGTFFMGYANVSTGALTTSLGVPTWVDFEGSIIAPPGTWISCSSGSATCTTAVIHCSGMWAEVPI